VRVAEPAECSHERVSFALRVKATWAVTRFARDAELGDGGLGALVVDDPRAACRRMAGDAVRAPANVVLGCVGRLEKRVAPINETPFVACKDEGKHVEIAVRVFGPRTLHVVRAGRDGDGRRAALGHRAVIRA
jgi:hypothetical protein